MPQELRKEAVSVLCQTKLMMPISHFLNEKPKAQKCRFIWQRNKSLLPNHSKPNLDFRAAS